MVSVQVSTDSELEHRHPRFEAVAARFLLSYDKAHTRSAYASDLRCFADWCAQFEVDPISVQRVHLEGFARWMETEGLAAASVARRLSALSSFFRYSLEEGLVERNPAAHVRRPSVSEDSPTLGLDRAEALAFLQAGERSGIRDHALVSLLMLNGLRVSEVCSALVEDLGDERGHRVLRVRRKGGRLGLAPLAPRTTAALMQHVGDRDQGPLILGNDGAGLNRFQAVRIIRRLASSAGIDKNLSPHSLRHTAVTLALDAGVPLRDVQDMAGHADPRTTRRYDRARMSLDRHATYRLANYLS